MLWYAAAAALALWLLLLGYAAVAARPRWTRPGPPSHALRDEPPAVVSLLAGRVDRDGFPATVLDLAARGWLVLDHRSSGQLACLLPDSMPAERLTPYEAMAVEHVTVRASGSGWVPVAALAADFRPARRHRHVEDDLHRFAAQVRSEAARRGLVSRLPGGPPLLILGVLGLAPLALGAAALARTHTAAGAFLTAAGLYLILLSCLRLLRRDRLTRAGRAALAGWLGFRLALTDLDRAGVLRTALFIAGDRRAAYAVALGAAPAAAAAFRPDGDGAWSSHGGWWHQVDVGGTRRARRWRRPAVTELDGQVVRRWTEVVRDDDGPLYRYWVAIDDGQSDRAWTLRTSDRLYEETRVGLAVQAQIDPRRGWLTGLVPREPDPAGQELAGAAVRQASRFGLPGPVALVTAEDAAELIGGPVRGSDLVAAFMWRPAQASRPTVLVQIASSRMASLTVRHARRNGQPVAGLTGSSAWLVDGRKLVLECAQGMVSVRLDGGPPENAALALTRLAPVIAARLASAAEPDATPA